MSIRYKHSNLSGPHISYEEKRFITLGNSVKITKPFLVVTGAGRQDTQHYSIQHNDNCRNGL
jgi:hypothetical protein